MSWLAIHGLQQAPASGAIVDHFRNREARVAPLLKTGKFRWHGSLYYKGMLAVHLENGAVTTREIPLPHRPPGFALLRLLAGGQGLRARCATRRVEGVGGIAAAVVVLSQRGAPRKHITLCVTVR